MTKNYLSNGKSISAFWWFLLHATMSGDVAPPQNCGISIRRQVQYIMNNREKLGGCLPMRSPAKAAKGMDSFTLNISGMMEVLTYVSCM